MPDESRYESLAETPPGASGARAGEFLSFDSVAHEYDWSRYLPPEMQAQAARLLRESAGLAPGAVLLDAGVGTGRFALPLAQIGVPVVGADISDGMLAQLQAKRAALEAQGSPLPLRVVRADLRRLPFASGVFDAALVVHILHLIADWQAVLGEIERVLAPGGMLLLAQESGRGVPTRDYYMEMAAARGLLRPHIGTRNRDEIRTYLVEHGAQVARVDDDRLHWRHPLKIHDILEMTRRRTWSSLWTVPDADHAEMMAATEAWARETYGSLDVAEEPDMMLMIWTARWLR
jgi:ubiquinone/menaquinone biosynthesis C-methylase UbiE